MKTVAALLALAGPLCARAVPIYVEYDGVVSAVSRTVCMCDPTLGKPADDPEFTGYSVGDRIKGLLTLDIDKGVRDAHAEDPELGVWQFAGGGRGDFIGGNGPPAPSRPVTINDSVSVSPGRAGGPTSSYSVDDWWTLPNGFGGMSLTMSTERKGVISNDWIGQNFNAVPDEQTRLTGHFSKLVETATGKATYAITLALNSLSVTPGSCRRP